MRLATRVSLALVVAIGMGTLLPRAQMRAVPIDELQGHAALGLALRHLNNTGIFMMATAHPDDENNALLVLLTRGLGFRTALATATRGNGGQNEIGPELFEALGVLRTEELAAVHRFDGAEQYFTRAVDFGFSFSVDETFAKWGREEILGDYVRLIRAIRPDVVTALPRSAAGGGQHHQASAILAHEAFAAAADPAKFPEQLKAGLRVWQPSKFYFTRQPGGDGDGVRQLTVNLAAYDRLLGRTYAEIGSEARSMHKCQGMQQLLSLPGPSAAVYELAESKLPGAAQRAEAAVFDGIDTSLPGLVRFVGGKPPKELVDALNGIAVAVQLAQRKFDTEGDAAALAPLLIGLRATRTTRGQLRPMNIPDGARFEIDYRLRQKEREFQQAILAAAGVSLEALAADGVVVPGQQVPVSVYISNRGLADVAVKQVKFDGFQSGAGCTLTPAVARGRAEAPAGPPLSVLARDQVAQCTPTLAIPANARPTEPYWHRAGDEGRYTFDEDAAFGLPYRPTPFYVQVTFGFASGEEVFGGLAITYRYVPSVLSGEKRSELIVVPPVSVRVTPEIAIIPASPPAPPPAPPAAAPPRPTGTQGRGGRAAAPPPPPPPPPVVPTREIRVSIVNNSRGPSEYAVHLNVPQDWTVAPAEQTVKFAREDESQTVRFDVKPPVSMTEGAYTVRAIASAEGVEVARGFQVVEYPHTRRQHLYAPAEAIVKIVDVKTSPNLTVGYIMGVGDSVPAAIEQLGAKVEMITPDDLAWGNLSRFQTIVTGVRAYESRRDLRANNSRLIDFVRSGGTLVVQYNKTEFNEAQYGPHPAEVTQARVTDETAPVRVTAPADPLFNTPNKITDAAWNGWVQERGLYFLEPKDSRYRSLVTLEDPFPANSGEKTGALVTTQYGKGRWVYVGLALWRQLPAGVVGAFQLLANLISLGH